MPASDDFYLKQEEPVKSCLLAMRDIILSQDREISNPLKYGMPFFCYRGKMICYLWIHKKHQLPYLGLVEGRHFSQPGLLQEKRSKMKILLIDPNEDLPIATIRDLLVQAIAIQAGKMQGKPCK